MLAGLSKDRPSLVAAVSLDLEYGNAFFHYAFYVLVTMVLRFVCGMPWVWTMPKTPGM